MPTLKHLIDELKKLDVSPDEVRLPGTLYDDLVEQAEDNIEDEEEQPSILSGLSLASRLELDGKLIVQACAAD